MSGSFSSPVRLAEAIRSDDAIFTARENRTDPISAVATRLDAYDSDRGRAVAAKARGSVSISRSVLKGVVGTLADHGVAIGYAQQSPNDEGTLINFRLTEWPLEWVRWNEARQTLETQTADGVGMVDIIHGDGRWIVFRKYLDFPWRQGACLLPLSFVWPAHAEGIADWAASSRAHGLAKIVGELPEGSAINGADGELTTQAQQFVEMIEALAEGDSPVGLRPFGSKTDFLANGSTAWQVFSEFVADRAKAAARIYLGTDAMLGSVGGAPGVDISALFGVATTKVQGDFDALEAGLESGVYAPWTAINFGDSRYTPSLKFLLPDPDEDRKRDENRRNHERLHLTLEEMKAQKLEVTQDVVNQLAAEFGVAPAPQLAAIENQSTSIELAPTDVAKIVRVREARSSQGLAPFGDERDDMTLTQLDAWNTESAKAKALE